MIHLSEFDLMNRYKNQSLHLEENKLQIHKAPDRFREGRRLHQRGRTSATRAYSVP